MIGLNITLLAIILVFERPSTGSQQILDLGEVEDIPTEIIDIPPTEQPPPPPPRVQSFQIIEIPDEQLLKEEIDIELDVEVHEETVIQDIVFEERPQEEEIVDEIFTVVEKQPEFPGGMAAFYEFINANIKYPVQARRLSIQGRVYVQFIVNKEGKLTDFEVVKGIGAGCDEEAVRVLKLVPNFQPGKQRGQPVKVKMVIPIYFKMAQ